MYKLVVFAALLAVAFAKPDPAVLAYTAPVAPIAYPYAAHPYAAHPYTYTAVDHSVKTPAATVKTNYVAPAVAPVAYSAGYPYGYSYGSPLAYSAYGYHGVPLAYSGAYVY